MKTHSPGQTRSRAVRGVIRCDDVIDCAAALKAGGKMDGLLVFVNEREEIIRARVAPVDLAALWLTSGFQ